ncbi:hypothetical protein J4437_00610 [Candidatus Woesearchaeota archaeon]|nr:hypothetical protein [Candidatus Woesearchaeota archaeon]
MTLSITLPLLEKTSSVKDMAFSVLMHEFPLSLMKILNAVNKQYNKSFSFQAVRKAVLQLVEEGVLEKEGKEFSVNKEWILKVIKFGNTLQRQYFTTEHKGSKVQVSGNTTFYTLPTLVDLDYMWNGLIRQALNDQKTVKVITFKSVHFWFLIATLAQETELIKEMIKRGIKLYYICYGNTALDKWTVEMYNKIGVHIKLLPKPKNFTSGLNMGTYGNMLIQSQHPPELTKKIDAFFQKCKNPQDASLTDITELVTEKCEINLQVLGDPLVAETIRKDIIRQVLRK